MEKSKVFEETYDKYMSQISDIDLMPRAERIGAEPAGHALIVPYYKKPFRISTEGVFDVKGGVKVRRVAVENCDTWFIK